MPKGEGDPHKELISRLLADTCEICKQTDNIQVHHVRKLADLARTGDAQPDWVQLMARRRRKFLVVCGSCYERIQGWQSA
ncbi:RNA-directed DNA polymerase [Micromonospora sp. NPDC050200]|uniref:HNH endonuclease n=1 Tax=Micromonospora sp. NPDC050200 TaxID=3155664 RepID=UPI0033EF57EA